MTEPDNRDGAHDPPNPQEPVAVPAPRPTPPPAPAPVSSSLARALNLVIVPALCLGALTLMYTRLGGEITELRESQRQLVSEVAALRRTPMVDISAAPTRGNASAIVTMIEYSDYECPFCIKYFRETLPRITADYVDTGKIRYAFRDFPVDELHPAAIKAHEASRCAREQGQFWEMHTLLFSPPGTHGTEALTGLARDIGLQMDQFSECLMSGRTVDDIRQAGADAVAMGAAGTPAFFIGLYDPAVGQVRVMRGISGAQPYEVFQQTLDLLLQQAQ